MNEKKMVKALARCDGYVEFREDKYNYPGIGIKQFGLWERLPDYLNDHNAMQRLIDGLDGRYDPSDGEYHRFLLKLDTILERDYYKPEHDETFCAYDFVPLATCRQKAEAYLSKGNVGGGEMSVAHRIASWFREVTCRIVCAERKEDGSKPPVSPVHDGPSKG